MASAIRIQNIVKEVAKVAFENGINSSFVVGGYPRSLIMDNVKNDVHDLDFASAWPGECTKLGFLSAAKLVGEIPEIYHRTGTIVFNYKKTDLEFQGSLGPTSYNQNIINEMERLGIVITPLTINIYSRDFTINSLILDLNDLNIYDTTGFGVRDIKNGIIRTIINPGVITIENPLTILRSLRFSFRYNFRIDKKLEESIFKNGKVLLTEITPERLQLEVFKLMNESYDATVRMIKKYNLEFVLENQHYNIWKNLEGVDKYDLPEDLKSLIKETIV